MSPWDLSQMGDMLFLSSDIRGFLFFYAISWFLKIGLILFTCEMVQGPHTRKCVYLSFCVKKILKNFENVKNTF